MNQINLQLVQNEYLSGLSRQVEELSRLLRNAQKNEKKLVAEKKNQWFINKAAENIASAAIRNPEISFLRNVRSIFCLFNAGMMTKFRNGVKARIAPLLKTVMNVPLT